MVKTYWVLEDALSENNCDIIETIQVLKKSDVEKEIDDRIEFWSRPKPENIRVSPEEITIKTERMFEIQKRMIIEELKAIKKRLIKVD